jgi:hypothetical protein
MRAEIRASGKGWWFIPDKPVTRLSALPLRREKRRYIGFVGLLDCCDHA